MSRKNNKDNLFYNFYRYCNAQESCYNCKIHSLTHSEDFYEVLSEYLFEVMDFEDEIKKTSSCLRYIDKDTLNKVEKEINNWCEKNPELNLVDVYIDDCLRKKHKENKKTNIVFVNNFPPYCPYCYDYINENGYLKWKGEENLTIESFEEISYFMELMKPISCNQKNKNYNPKSKKCQECWMTPLRYV